MKRFSLILTMGLSLLFTGCLENGAKTVESLVQESKNTAMFQWAPGEWSSCSATACGTNGTQTRTVICKKNNNVTVADSNCIEIKPSTSQPCAAVACSYTYSWVTSGWSACSVTACGSSGTQTRFVSCTRNDGQVVVDSYCLGAKPSLTQTCSTPACPVPSGFVPPVRTRGIASINVADYGALGNGIHDDTTAIQTAVNALPSTGGTVNVPPGNYLIDSLKSIKLRSNMLFKMDPNAILRTKTNSAENGTVLAGELVHDLEISGGQIIGDRDTHLGTTGEWGMGIKLNGATKTTVRDVKLTKHWGDGIYVGGHTSAPVTYGNDVVLYNVFASQNRRQGLSITNAENVKVYNSEFSYTEGTPPQYGIDIEPNQITTRLETSRYARNIEIVDCKIHHNKGGGIQFYKFVSNVLVKNNELTYNSRGLYTIESSDSTITGNLIAHNRNKGIAFQTNSNNFSVTNNVFRNNWTDQFGFTNDTNPLQTIIGLQNGTGGNGTTPHIGIQPDTGVINVLTNKYAK